VELKEVGKEGLDLAFKAAVDGHNLDQNLKFADFETPIYY
jgi:hypothetical protein